MNFSTIRQESILEVEGYLHERRLQAAAFSVVCVLSALFALAALSRLPEFAAAQASGKVLATLLFGLLVFVCVLDNVRTHVLLWKWLQVIKRQKK
ncbi:MAG: hypothetical protein KDE51_22660, partial [Anaerolineales bacterium]|nr:hypothetical protein [Anaerolineales bacterium]